MKLENYDNIIFDLGGVILNLDYDQTLAEFKKFIPGLDDEKTFLGKEGQHSFYTDYEVGGISTQEFKRLFEEHHKISFRDFEFEGCWNAMLFDFPRIRLDLIKVLKEKKKIFLLSNINELHEVAVAERFSQLSYEVEFKKLFDRIYFSHHVGLRKPNPEIFELLIRENSLDRARTLFIDDSLQHVVSARKVGIEAIHLQKNQRVEDLELFKGILNR